MSPNKHKTRHTSGTKMSELLGSGKKFTLSELPTLREVLRFGIWLRMQDTGDNRNYSNKNMARDIVQKLIGQWERANDQFKNPVITSEKTLCDKIVALWEKVFRLANDKVTAPVELKNIYSKLYRLFDITKCHCPIMTCQETSSCQGCPSSFHIKCDCSKEQKIPVLELGFIRAQREKIGTFSTIMIANKDDKETKKQIKTAERKAKETSAEEQQTKEESQRQNQVRESIEKGRTSSLTEVAECGLERTQIGILLILLVNPKET